jgi:hypothetical protein
VTNHWRLLATALLTLILHAEAPVIRMENGNFLVSGWTGDVPQAGWESVFAVYAGTGDVPPMLGAYSFEAGGLIFHPRYPISSGVTYRAVLRAESGPVIEKSFQTSTRTTQGSTAVAHVYPSTNTLPENTLKLYVEFSGPMSRGYAWQHIHLLDASGAAVELPFLEVDQELWDPAFRRMTVLFDPGRIKRGLVPNQDAGSPMEEGRRYTLVIDRGWPDASGNPLAAEIRKSFTVGLAERTGIDLKQWHVHAGKTLTVTFPRPLDYALLSHAIRVIGPGGDVIEGTAKIDLNETRWSFVPATGLMEGEYRLQIDMALEDVAGNRIGRAFDVDVFERGAERITRKTIDLSFRVSGQ